MITSSKSAGLAAAIFSLVCAGSVYADTISSVIGGQASSGVNFLNFDNLANGSTASATYGSGSSQVTLSFGGNGQVDVGSEVSPFPSSQPNLTGNNGVHFGSPNQANGLDVTPYVTSGTTPNGYAMLSFASAQSYLGFLWGSMDSYNTLTFWTGANATGTSDVILGPTVQGDTAGLVPSGGSNGLDPNGTAYVNIFTSTAFQSVVFSSSNYNFEIDDVAYGNVPDGGMTALLLGLGFAGLALFGIRQNRLQVAK
jgi:hypothetical protein